MIREIKEVLNSLTNSTISTIQDLIKVQPINLLTQVIVLIVKTLLPIIRHKILTKIKDMITTIEIITRDRHVGRLSHHLNVLTSRIRTKTTCHPIKEISSTETNHQLISMKISMDLIIRHHNIQVSTLPHSNQISHHTGSPQGSNSLEILNYNKEAVVKEECTKERMNLVSVMNSLTG